MPPIPQQQSSRTGLIAALVTAIVFAVGFLIWAIMSSADANRALADLSGLRSKYSQVIGDSAVGSVADLKSQMSADPSKPRPGTLVDAAVEQRQSLMTLLIGDKAASEKRAADEYAALVKSFESNPGLKDANIPKTGGTINIAAALASKAAADAAALEKARADLKKANDDFQAAVASHQAEIAKRDQTVAEAQAASQKAIADAAAAIAEKDKQVQDLSNQVVASNKNLTDFQAQSQVTEQTLNRAIETSKQQIEKLTGQLVRFKPSAKDSIVRNVDARITQIAPDNICYIDLGYGNHVSPGLTFEVYDRFEGIPKMGDSDAELPKGKASIEIINVGQNSSQCRVLRTAIGQTLTQGDVCSNLVYDRNTKLTFYVYGKFDMDNNGVATDGEADIVKNLITRWGGKITDRLGTEVDFVVMGKEPQVPVYSAEELQQPIPKAKFDEAKAALDAYTKVANDATGLHLPVMNQTRFLYYTGYFDASKR
jgi:hypothetical protein